MDFFIDMVPFVEVGRHRHGRDGRGLPDLSRIVADVRECVQKHMQLKGERGSDMIFKRIVRMDIFIVLTQLGRRLQTRRHVA